MQHIKTFEEFTPNGEREQAIASIKRYQSMIKAGGLLKNTETAYTNRISSIKKEFGISDSELA